MPGGAGRLALTRSCHCGGAIYCDVQPGRVWPMAPLHSSIVVDYDEVVTMIRTQNIVQPRSCAYHSSSSSSSDGGPAIHALQGPSDSAPDAPSAA